MSNNIIKPHFIDIINRFDNDIDLLKAYCAEEDPTYVSVANHADDKVAEDKFKLSMELNRAVSYTIFLPFVDYYKFRKRCNEEGYNMQEGFSRLVHAFVEDKLNIIKED